MGPAVAFRRVVPRLVVAVIGWIIVAIACARLGLLVKNSRHQLYDFAQEWTSARNVLTHEPVYQPLSESLPRYFPRLKTVDLSYNGHPPFSVLVCLPLGALSYPSAYVCWNLVSALITLLALRVLVGRAGLQLDGIAVCGLALILATGNALEQQFLQGQWNCVLLGLLTFAWFAERQGRSGWSGALIGLAGAIKLFPAFLLVYFVARRDWRAVAMGVGVLAVLNAGTALVLGADSYVAYFGTVAPNVSRYRDTWPNASLLGYWSKLFDGEFGHVQTIVKLPLLARALTVVSAGLLVGDVIRCVHRAAGTVQRDLTFALAMLAMLLVSPITWDHYFVMLPLPLAILWKHARSRPQQVGLVLAAVCLATLRPSRFWILTVPGYAEFGESAAVATPAMTLSLIAYQNYVLLGLYLLARRIVAQATNAVVPAPAGEVATLAS